MDSMVPKKIIVKGYKSKIDSQYGTSVDDSYVAFNLQVISHQALPSGLLPKLPMRVNAKTSSTVRHSLFTTHYPLL